MLLPFNTTGQERCSVLLETIPGKPHIILPHMCERAQQLLGVDLVMRSRTNTGACSSIFS